MHSREIITIERLLTNTENIELLRTDFKLEEELGRGDLGIVYLGS